MAAPRKAATAKRPVAKKATTAKKATAPRAQAKKPAAPAGDRSAAANKAWETRRASGDGGTSAAKKAWETRRANGWTPKGKVEAPKPAAKKGRAAKVA